MRDYRRVMPRDLFNEASLLKCYGLLVIVLGEVEHLRATLEQSDDMSFSIGQDPSSGAISIENVVFAIDGLPYGLERPLNSRRPWPLVVATGPDPDFEEIDVFDDEGDLTSDMLRLVSTTVGVD